MRVSLALPSLLARDLELRRLEYDISRVPLFRILDRLLQRATSLPGLAEQ